MARGQGYRDEDCEWLTWAEAVARARLIVTLVGRRREVVEFPLSPEDYCEAGELLGDPGGRTWPLPPEEDEESSRPVRLRLALVRSDGGPIRDAAHALALAASDAGQALSDTAAERQRAYERWREAVDKRAGKDLPGRYGQ